MSDFIWWFKNPLFSNVWIMNPDTQEKFPAHVICLSTNPFFEQLFKSIDQGASLLTRESDDKIIIEVSNLKIASIYTKVIYSSKYDTTDITINLANREEILEWLHYAEMWFMSEAVLVINFKYVHDNLEKILDTDIKLIPELCVCFQRQFENSIYNFQLKILEYMQTHPHSLFHEMLEWDISQHFDGKLIISLMSKCDDVPTVYRYYQKFMSEIVTKDIVALVHNWKDLIKINQFYQLIDPTYHSLLTNLIKDVHQPQTDSKFGFYLDKLGDKVMSMITYADFVRKDIKDIKDTHSKYVDYLLLESFYPFKGRLFVSIEKVGDSLPSCTPTSFPMYVQSFFKVGDQLYFSNRCHEVIRIMCNHKSVTETYPLLLYYVTCKDCPKECFPKVNTYIYKIEHPETWNLSSPKAFHSSLQE